MKGATERISRFKGGWPAVMVKVDEKMGLGLRFWVAGPARGGFDACRGQDRNTG